MYLAPVTPKIFARHTRLLGDKFNILDPGLRHWTIFDHMFFNQDHAPRVRIDKFLQVFNACRKFARLPGNLNVSFEGVDGEALMTGLKTIAVSSGSACTSSDPEPSHVLRAMGRSDQLTRASLRFGFGRFNTPDDVNIAVDAVVEVVRRLRISLNR